MGQDKKHSILISGEVKSENAGHQGNCKAKGCNSGKTE